MARSARQPLVRPGGLSATAPWRWLPLALALMLTIAPVQTRIGTAAAGYDWRQFDGSPWHSGTNTLESTITAANVGTLRRLFQVTLPAVADGAPAYLTAISTTTGVRDLLFVTTKAGHILALDAHTGMQVWSHQYPAGSCRINNGGTACYTTSSPAVGPGRQTVFSYGLDGYVHAYLVGSGTEIKSGGWPEQVTRKPFNEKGSSALTIATVKSGATYVYATNGGYLGDNGDYQGHLTAINLTTGVQKVFNAVCSDQAVHFVETPGTPDCHQVQSAIWARDGVVYDPRSDRLYAATGNGTFAPASHDWGDSVFALNPDGSGQNGGPLDSYTPADYQNLQNGDTDLGSTAPALLPVLAGSTVTDLAVQSGKDALLRLLNLDNLSGQGGPGHTGGEVGTVIGVPQGGEVLTAPAVWVNPADHGTWVFVANDNGISGLRVVVNGSGTPVLQPVWQTSSGGSSPLVANGVLYYAGGGGIQALNPLTGATLWQDTTIGGIHWESPIVANGVLYITDESNHLTAYALGAPAMSLLK